MFFLTFFLKCFFALCFDFYRDFPLHLPLRGALCTLWHCWLWTTNKELVALGALLGSAWRQFWTLFNGFQTIFGRLGGAIFRTFFDYISPFFDPWNFPWIASAAELHSVSFTPEAPPESILTSILYRFFNAFWHYFCLSQGASGAPPKQLWSASERLRRSSPRLPARPGPDRPGRRKLLQFSPESWPEVGPTRPNPRESSLKPARYI